MYQDEVSGSLIEIVDKIIERIGNNKKGYWEIKDYYLIVTDTEE